MGKDVFQVVLVALVLVASGCVGSDAAEPEQATGPADIPAPGDDTGAVQGQVLDDSVQPIRGAQVAIAETQASTVTDAGGSFFLGGLAPGTYAVFAAALGYESAAKKVEVSAGSTTPVTFALTPIPITVAYHEVFGPYQGYFECRIGHPSTTGECGWVGSSQPHPTQLYPNDRSIFRINLTSDDLRTAVGDMQWRQGTFGTSTKMRLAFSYDLRPGSHWWCSGEEASPLQWRWESDGEGEDCANKGGTSTPAKPTMKDNPMRIYANVPFGSTSTSNPNPVYVSLQQKFEVVASLFYGERAPDGYAAFSDA